MRSPRSTGPENVTENFEDGKRSLFHGKPDESIFADTEERIQNEKGVLGKLTKIVPSPLCGARAGGKANHIKMGSVLSLEFERGEAWKIKSLEKGRTLTD